MLRMYQEVASPPKNPEDIYPAFAPPWRSRMMKVTIHPSGTLSLGPQVTKYIFYVKRTTQSHFNADINQGPYDQQRHGLQFEYLLVRAPSGPRC